MRLFELSPLDEDVMIVAPVRAIGTKIIAD
jgi:hypothetical protein